MSFLHIYQLTEKFLNWGILIRLKAWIDEQRNSQLSLPEGVINDVADLTADYTFARFEALKGRYKAVENEG